jgi:hypothetical protein
MAEEKGPPGADVVDVFVAVGVEDVGGFAAGDEGRVAADAAAGADGGVDASGDEGESALEQNVGFGVRHFHFLSHECTRMNTNFILLIRVHSCSFVAS